MKQDNCSGAAPATSCSFSAWKKRAETIFAGCLVRNAAACSPQNGKRPSTRASPLGTPLRGSDLYCKILIQQTSITPWRDDGTSPSGQITPVSPPPPISEEDRPL